MGNQPVWAANQTASPQLSSTSSLTLGANASLDLTNMQTTAGLYRLISSTGISGTFASVTGLNSNYLLRYGTVNADVAERFIPGYESSNACDLMAASPFPDSPSSS